MNSLNFIQLSKSIFKVNLQAGSVMWK